MPGEPILTRQIQHRSHRMRPTPAPTSSYESLLYLFWRQAPCAARGGVRGLAGHSKRALGVTTRLVCLSKHTHRNPRRTRNNHIVTDKPSRACARRWANIKQAKGANDKARAGLYTKLSKSLVTASRICNGETPARDLSFASRSRKPALLHERKTKNAAQFISVAGRATQSTKNAQHNDSKKKATARRWHWRRRSRARATARCPSRRSTRPSRRV